MRRVFSLEESVGCAQALGERAVRAASEHHVILRTSWIFSASGRNFVKTMIRAAEKRDELQVVNDQFGCPTLATDIAEAILAIVPLLKGGTWGTYHYCGAGRTTWFDFAREIFSVRAKLGDVGGNGRIKVE